jgi:AcrR family transcriptional regulator
MAQTTIAARAADRPVRAVRERSEAEVDRILGAAEAVLAARGYEGLRVDDVLAEAGLSTRAFYRHFRGKAELFVALFDREADRAHERLRAKVDAVADPEAKVRTWIASTLALAYDARVARRTVVFLVARPVIARDFPDEIEATLRSQRRLLEDAIAAGRDAGRFPNADPAVDAVAIHHLCTGLMTDQLLGISTLDHDQAVAVATGCALQTLNADGRERRPRPGSSR